MTYETVHCSHYRVTWHLILSSFAALMGSFQFGYNTGVINSPQKFIGDFINETEIHRTGSPISYDQRRTLISTIVAMFTVGGIIGAAVTGFWSEKIGRSRGMAVNSWLGVVGAVFMFASTYAKSYEMIIIGRLVIGFQCGLYTGIVPLYLTEISYSSIRGALGTANQFFVTIGILISQILGFDVILGSQAYWHVLLGLTAIPALIQFFLFLYCPESPRYLLLVKENCPSSESALRNLRGNYDVAAELEDIRCEGQVQEAEMKMSVWSVLKSKELRWPLIVAIVMQLSQQLSGVNGVIYYSQSLFVQAGLSSTDAQYATSGVGADLVVMTGISIILMDRVGRRPLHLIGIFGMLISCILITITLALKTYADWLKIASIVVMLLYVTFFSVGPGSIPWIVVSELFTYGPRSSAMSIATFINWCANCAVAFLFPVMQDGLKDYAFLPFAVLLLLFFIFIYKYFPETKNRTVMMIFCDMQCQSEVDSLTSERTHLVKNK